MSIPEFMECNLLKLSESSCLHIAANKFINDENEEFVTLYWNKAKVKNIYNGQRTIIERQRLKFEDENPILSTLVPLYKLEPLEKISSFQFPSVCFNVYTEAHLKVDRLTI